MNLDAIKEIFENLWYALFEHFKKVLPEEILNMLGQLPMPLGE